MQYFCPQCEHLLTGHQKPKHQSKTKVRKILSCEFCKKSYLVADSGLTPLDQYLGGKKLGVKKWGRQKLCPECKIPLSYYRKHLACFYCGYVHGYKNNSPDTWGNTWRTILGKIEEMNEF